MEWKLTGEDQDVVEISLPRFRKDQVRVQVDNHGVLRATGEWPARGGRRALGRGSRVLRRLLSAAEVELVMRSERECAANQLRAEDVYVNGSRLSPEELVVLQGCPCPPSRLRPGFYWYDKVSGFWGKVSDSWRSEFSFADPERYSYSMQHRL